MLRDFLHELRQIETSRKSLRSFGLLIGGLLTALALWLLWRASWSELTGWSWHGIPDSALVLGIVGLGLMLIGVLLPHSLGIVYVAWMGIATLLGMIMTQVILTLVFLLVVTPTGIVMRLAGKDPLKRSFNASQESYWIPRKEADPASERLEKYF